MYLLQMQESPISGQCELKDDTGALFAVVCVDLVFAYGDYGFGESLQVCHVNINLIAEYYDNYLICYESTAQASCAQAS